MSLTGYMVFFKKKKKKGPHWAVIIRKLQAQTRKVTEPRQVLRLICSYVSFNKLHSLIDCIYIVASLFPSVFARENQVKGEAGG